MKSLADPGTVEVVKQRARRLSPESRRRWGRMTCAEMICHLAEAYRHNLGELPPSPVDTVFTRNVLKPVALWLPIPWPHGFPTRAVVDPRREGRKPADFTRDRETLESTLDRFVAAARAGTMVRNAIFGEMSEREWLRYGWLHADHHMRQFGV